jgi:hypothetical protein
MKRVALILACFLLLLLQKSSLGSAGIVSTVDNKPYTESLEEVVDMIRDNLIDPQGLLLLQATKVLKEEYWDYNFENWESELRPKVESIIVEKRNSPARE